MDFRPRMHFSPERGWINDPNGLIHFKGMYHLFFQYNPYSTRWGMMHWGHAVSRDMIDWQVLPIALTPSEEYELDEKGGCFSGSAIEKDGRLYLFYTGSVIRDGRTIQTQNMAFSDDGIHFEKHPGNPIISELPPGSSDHFRDPKVFRYGGTYFMVTGCSIDGDAAVFLFASDDLVDWGFRSVLFRGDHRHGTLMECPDLFRLGSKWILTGSPEHHPEGIRSLVLIGDFDADSGRFIEQGYMPADYGYEHYAAQSFESPDGRRISFAWMNEWEWMSTFAGFSKGPDDDWCGCLTMPREFSLIDGSLRMHPAKEATGRFRDGWFSRILELSPDAHRIDLPDGCWGIEVRYSESRMRSSDLMLDIVDSSGFLATMDLNPERGYATIECRGRGPCVIPISRHAEHSLSVFFDHCALEVFIDGGERCASFMVYPSSEDLKLEARTPQKTASADIAIRSLQ